MQRPQGMKQVGCRLTCFGGEGDLEEGSSVRGCKTLDAKLGGVIWGHWEAMGGIKLERNKVRFGFVEEPYMFSLFPVFWDPGWQGGANICRCC